MEHKWYNESNKREGTLYASFLQNRSHDRLIVLIPMTMRSLMFGKFDSYPQAICFKGSYSADVVSMSFACQRVDYF